MKICSRCKIEKDENHFLKHKPNRKYRTNKDGYSGVCRKCKAGISLASYHKLHFKGENSLVKKVEIPYNDLFEMYILNKVGTGKIAKKYKCSNVTVLNKLKKYGIPIWDLKYWRLGKPGLKGDLSPSKRPEVQAKLRGPRPNIRGEKNPNYDNHKLAGANNPNWLGGVTVVGDYPYYFNKALKRRIIKRDNYMCQECGVQEPIEVHHIDFNKMNCADDNLITLCKRHNVQANYKREYFKQYYKEKVNEILQLIQ